MEEKYVDQIIEILLKAGVIAKRYFGRKYEYSTKANASDFVTEVDVLLDTYLKNEI
jgi:fructose-1,6-bisphosphatase/inositol monophosphatase family enzyme